MQRVRPFWRRARSRWSREFEGLGGGPEFFDLAAGEGGDAAAGLGAVVGGGVGVRDGVEVFVVAREGLVAGAAVAADAEEVGEGVVVVGQAVGVEVDGVVLQVESPALGEPAAAVGGAEELEAGEEGVVIEVGGQGAELDLAVDAGVGLGAGCVVVVEVGGDE